MKKNKKVRHQNAKTSVEVYRLFKVRDAGAALRQSSDSVVARLGMEVVSEANAMLETYINEQRQLEDCKKAPSSDE